MQVIRGLHNLRPEHRGCVATIGNFDGVHLGHQAVFRLLQEKGAELGLPLTVVVFEPQPLEFFRPECAPARLTRLREKLKALEESGIDRVLVLEFNRHLAGMEAEEFVRSLLLDGLGIGYLYVGDDFRFGKDRRGDMEMLRRFGRQAGFGVEAMGSYQLHGERVSSTRIRELLVAGDIPLAEQLLGRPYRICGRVAHGDARGRTIGFPTANVDLHRRVSPLSGVYAVSVLGLQEEPLPGVANIGRRPTVTADDRYLLEVHLFDFNREIYGRHVEVQFHRQIREEMKFDSFEALRRQIEQDALEARDLLGC